MPAQIVRILANQKAIVRLGGIEKEISTILVDNISTNDYVIIHVGYALTKLDENEAKKTLKIFEEMQDIKT